MINVIALKTGLSDTDGNEILTRERSFISIASEITKPDLEKSGLHPCYENRNVISIKIMRS
jgi:hypothetical protein